MYDFKGKVAVVTGGASGIGFALAERLAGLGRHIALAGRGGGCCRRRPSGCAALAWPFCPSPPTGCGERCPGAGGLQPLWPCASAVLQCRRDPDHIPVADECRIEQTVLKDGAPWNANLLLESCGGVLTRLTADQASYIGVDRQGPFKPADLGKV